jgi:hypothetical protein
MRLLDVFRGGADMCILIFGGHFLSMRGVISLIVHVAAVSGILLAVAVDPAAAVVLITAEEAALPDAVGAAHELGVRGVTRGPMVSVVFPAPDAGAVRSPLRLLLRFESHGGAGINPNSVKVVYLKNPAINLTQRIGDLVVTGGIDLRSAEVPPGTHYIRVEIKDTAGRLGSATFALLVLK